MPINWERASHIAQCIQAVAVTVTLGFIVYQLGQQAYHLAQQSHQLHQQAEALQQQVALTRASNVQSLAEMMIPINMKLTETEMANLWKNGPPADDDIMESKYESLLANYLIFYENVYSQYQAGLLPQKIYLGWDADLEGVIMRQPIECYWPDWKDGYHEDFRKHVDELVNTKPKCRRPATPAASSS